MENLDRIENVEHQIDIAVKDRLAFPPEVRQKLIEPSISFLLGVKRLSVDQVAYLIALKEYHATLTQLIEAGKPEGDA